MDPDTALPGRIQVTDRFSHALERLGSAELHVRIAGVYSLQQVMRNSGEHHNDIVEVLAAFVRAAAGRNIARITAICVPPVWPRHSHYPHGIGARNVTEVRGAARATNGHGRPGI